MLTFNLTAKATFVLKGKEAKKQIAGAKEIFYNSTNQPPVFIKFETGKAPLAKNLETQLLKWYNLKKPYGFKLAASTTDKLGFTHYRFEQFYQGYPVKNKVIYVHVKHKKIVSINGDISNNLNEMFSFKLDFLNALVLSKKYIGAITYKWEIPAEEFHIAKRSKKKTDSYFPKNKLILIDDKAGKFKLCYEIDVFAHQPESRKLVYVNAITGKIERTENLICNNSVETEVETKTSGKRVVVVNDTIVTGKYALLDLTRGGGIGIVDSRSLDLITDNDNSWTLSEYDNSSRDYAAIDCHWGATITYDYFLDTHNRYSFDNNGAPVECRVHQTYDNGSTNNASWTGQYIAFGDGLGFSNAFTALDIVAHEFTHAVTEYSAGLVYAGESGALNESFSDIFATIVEFYAKPPYEAGNWLIGEDVGSAKRSLQSPNIFRDPDTYGSNDPYWVEIDGCWPAGNNDNCGVHTNSGVQNHWFYLLANGGNGINHNGDAYSVTGIGIEKAAEIAYRNLTVYLTPRSRYADAKRYSIEAAKDLYGDCPAPQELISTINAWYAVGLGDEYNEENQLQPQVNLLSPRYYCSFPQTVSFYASSNFSNIAYSWRVNDNTLFGDTVSYTFNSAGSYNITLKAYSCNTTSTIVETGLIVINNERPCVLNMPYNSKSTEKVCSGTLYDFNGPGNFYSDLSNGIVTIVSPYNQPVNLLFTELGYEPDYDYLYIYDGPDTTSNLITRLNGYNIPDTIKSTGSSITIKHFSDLYVVDAGFTLNWWSDDCPNAIEVCLDEQIFVDNSIANSGTVKAKTTIQSNQIITNNNNLVYNAGESINLINDFEIGKDGNFLAEIEDCDN